MTTRKQYRHKVGRALGRNYWDVSTVGASATANEIPDAKRTEYPAFWDGASLKVVGSDEVYLRGGGGSIRTGTGKLYTDRALSGGAPAQGVEYEVLKGWTFADVDEALEWSFDQSYPEFFTPISDTSTAVEVANTISTTLPATWKHIAQVRREAVKGATPAFYEPLYEGRDFRIGYAATGALTLELLFTPEAGRKIWVLGRAAPTLASGDAGTGTPDIPWQVIVPGALHYLFDKGINADDVGGALTKRFESEAAIQLSLFEKRKTEFRMKPMQVRRASFPVISETNIGLTVLN